MEQYKIDENLSTSLSCSVKQGKYYNKIHKKILWGIWCSQYT